MGAAQSGLSPGAEAPGFRFAHPGYLLKPGCLLRPSDSPLQKQYGRRGSNEPECVIVRGIFVESHMSAFADIGLSLENYKSFGNGIFGFDRLATVNVIVGRNNSGKSALLDAIAIATKPAEIPAHLHHGNEQAHIVSAPLLEGAVKSAFPEGTSGGPISGNHWQAGKALVGARIKFDVQSKKHRLVELSRTLKQVTSNPLRQQYEQLASGTTNPGRKTTSSGYPRTAILPPEQITGAPTFTATGQGFTLYRRSDTEQI